jgi:potassium voltage-gated channel Eag-related subfamily H protein 6
VVQALSSYTTKRGIIISGPANTISHYCTSTWALADFLSCVPFEYMVSKGRFLGVAKVIRLVKISQLMRRFHSAKKAGVFRLIRLISIVLLVSHCLACYWNWVAQEWRLHEAGYLAKSIPEQYVHSWSIVIGSLNASPPVMFTPIEEISVAVFMLMGNVLQASVFGSVAVLIQSFDEEEVAYNKKLLNTYERCKMLDIPEPLADRINSFYEHLYRETRSVDPDADAFINELSPALICEVKFQLYKDMVKQIPFFSSANINPVLIETLILRLRTVIYMQDDMLIRKGEFGDWMGFVGSKGSVGVLDPNSEVDKIVRILRKGEYFGEMGLLHRTKRTTTAVALSWVQIHVLSRDDLDQVKEQYVEDAESLDHEIRKYMRSRVPSVMELTSN